MDFQEIYDIIDNYKEYEEAPNEELKIIMRQFLELQDLDSFILLIQKSAFITKSHILKEIKDYERKCVSKIT